MKCMFILLFSTIQLLSYADNSYANYSHEEFIHLKAFNAPVDFASVDIALIEAGVFYFTNEYRIKKNRTILNYNENLSFAAYTHSEQMQMHRFFDHVNKKNSLLSTLEKRANYAGYIHYSTLAENIFYGYLDLKNIVSYRALCTYIVDAFISSKEHRENLLARDIDEIGCGIYFDKQLKDGYWYFNFTQDFGSTLMSR